MTEEIRNKSLHGSVMTESQVCCIQIRLKLVHKSWTRLLMTLSSSAVS